MAVCAPSTLAPVCANDNEPQPDRWKLYLKAVTARGIALNTQAALWRMYRSGVSFELFATRLEAVAAAGGLLT